MPRFFIENIDKNPGDSITVTGQDAVHMAKALRMKPGESVTVCGGLGFDLLCEITGVYGDSVELAVREKVLTESEPSVRITLYQGLPKGDKLEWIIEKTIELGVCEIVPVLMQRSVSRPDPKSAAKKHDRYQKQAVAAAKQSGRGIIPEVGEMIPFAQMIKRLSSHQTVIFFYECRGEPLSSVIDNIQTMQGRELTDLAIVIGPEGGFDIAEAEALQASGAFTATLGKRILRTETAPIAALAAIMYATGNME